MAIDHCVDEFMGKAMYNLQQRNIIRSKLEVVWVEA